MTYAANLPIIGSEKMKTKAATIDNLVKRLDGMLGIFKFFMDGTWIFES
jgi:hypothetical protein